MIRAAIVAVAATAAVLAVAAKADPTIAIPPPAAAPQAVPVQAAPAPSAPEPAAPAPTPPPSDRPAASVESPGAPPAGADQGGRYVFHRIGDAIVRLDSRSGEVSRCDGSAGAWACKLVPDERTALEAEIARVRRENGLLKSSLLSRGLDLPAGVMAEAKPRRADAPVPPENVPDATPHPPKEPSDADLGRAIAYMKQVWRKLVDMMLDLQRDVQRRG